MAKFIKCDVCGHDSYVIHDWQKNIPCEACEAFKRTQEETKMWQEYAAKLKGSDQ